MTDKEFVYEFLDMHYSIGSKGPKLIVYCYTASEKKMDMLEFITEVKLILGDFANEFARRWYEMKTNEVKTAVLSEIAKMDLDRGSYVLAHELAMDVKKMKYNISKDYTDAIFHQYYLKHKLHDDHRKLFQEFRVALSHSGRGWESYWGNTQMTDETVREFFILKPNYTLITILEDFHQWKTQAVVEETHRMMKLLQ